MTAPFFRPKVDRSLRRVIVGRGKSADVPLPSRGKLASVTDTLVEGVHFDLAEMTPRELAHKALAMGLSDAAAMGASPCFAQVTLGARQETAEPFVAEFESGLRALGRRFSVDIALGPRLDSPQALLVQTTVFSELAADPIGYDGARVGDAIVVTGSLGGSAAGLNCLRQLGRHALRDREELLQPHLTPEPRLEEAALLLSVTRPHAMVDLSDGLAAELHSLAEASGVGALVDQTALPLADVTRRAAALITANAMSWALYGAEDFELLAIIAAKDIDRVRRAFSKKKRALSVIGTIRPAKEGILLRDTDGEMISLAPRLWHNFVRRRRLSSR